LQDAQDLDFERLIRMVIDTHTRAIVREFALQLQHIPVLSLPGVVRVVKEGTHPCIIYARSFSHICLQIAGLQALHVHLCADEIVIVTIEPRTGKISLRDTGDLGAAGRGPSFLAISEKLNESPTVLLLEALTRLRIKVRNPILLATNTS
jgi:mediator of RNA polymerase II transcription subunit 14